MQSHRFTICLPQTDDGKRAAEFLRSIGRSKGILITKLINEYLNEDPDATNKPVKKESSVNTKNKADETFEVETDLLESTLPSDLSEEVIGDELTEQAVELESQSIETEYGPEDEMEEELPDFESSQFIGGMSLYSE